MNHAREVATLLALTALGLGCATSQAFDRTTEPGGRPLGTTTTGTVILTGDALKADVGWTVLDAVRRAMPALQVTDWTEYHCPVITIRGRDSVMGNSDPDVYVDGTRTTDTCPLTTIQAIQATRVEVYPQGVTSRPGYPSRGHGLILIFLQRG
jgi:hypothetical protein